MTIPYGTCKCRKCPLIIVYAGMLDEGDLLIYCYLPFTMLLNTEMYNMYTYMFEEVDLDALVLSSPPHPTPHPPKKI